MCPSVRCHSQRLEGLDLLNRETAFIYDSAEGLSLPRKSIVFCVLFPLVNTYTPPPPPPPPHTYTHTPLHELVITQYQISVSSIEWWDYKTKGDQWADWVLWPSWGWAGLNGCSARLCFSAFKSLSCSLQDIWPTLTTNQTAITTLHTSFYTVDHSPLWTATGAGW